MLKENNKNQNPRPFLERLINRDISQTYDINRTHTVSIEQLYEDIRQNLEHLLNSRLRYINISKKYFQLEQSLINYGLTDFMHSYYGSINSRTALCKQIGNAIEQFEPRLTNINIHIHNGDEDEHERMLRVRIEASIRSSAENKVAIFESSVDLTKVNFIFEGNN